jgi:glycosyltransferase involved in cell wall biosynthesis
VEPTVSVVVPAHNAEATLRDALESVLVQQPPVQQIVVVDDGSSDSTADVAASVPRVCVIRQARGGPSRARNRGLEVATSEWVAFLDADDRWCPGKIAAQFAVLARRPNAVIVAADWVRQGTPLSATGDLPFREFGTRDLLMLNRFQTSTVMVRREEVCALGGFDPELDGAEDWDLWLRCSRAGPVVKLDVPLVVYRDVPGGVSKDLLRLYRAMLVMLDREQGEGGLDQTTYSRIRAWHYLRFAVGFSLAGDRSSARAALADLRAAGLLRYAPSASALYLAPFLAGRLRRRLSARV